MRKLIFALVAPLALVACETVPNVPANPGQVADRTVLDERAALAVELAYRAAGLALELAVDAGAVRGETATRAAALERRAYSAVLAARAAYDAGNAASYAAAIDEARGAVADLLAAVKGS